MKGKIYDKHLNPTVERGRLKERSKQTNKQTYQKRSLEETGLYIPLTINQIITVFWHLQRWICLSLSPLSEWSREHTNLSLLLSFFTLGVCVWLYFFSYFYFLLCILFLFSFSNFEETFTVGLKKKKESFSSFLNLLIP